MANAQMEKMVAAMEAMLGLGEEGDNHNIVTEWYGEDGPWCDMLVSYAAFKSGNADAVCFGKKFAYTVAHADEFRAKGQWHEDIAGIQRGDIVFFDWDGSNRIGYIDHTGVVTGVSADGLTVSTVEGNVSNSCQRRQRRADTIVGYGRPKYSTGATTPAPVPQPPKETPVPTQYTPPAFPAGLQPDSARPSAKGLQAALKAAGYMQKTIAPADNYGPATQAAVALFYRMHPALSRVAYDPEIGPQGWKVLHEEAYGGAKKPSGVTPAPPATTTTASEPPADYRRISYDGKTVNVRTSVMLARARGLMSLAGQFDLTQGSYNRGVGASAGTHDGGGVVDINTSGLSVNATLRALRQAGFAAWYRTPAEGFAYHIHAVALGDREMSSSARSQVSAYFNGRNGLANNRADTAPASVGRPYPQWARRYA